MTSAVATKDRVIKHLLRASDVSLQPADVHPESTLRDHLALNSLQAVSLMLELEDEFGITVDDDDAVARLQTVDDLVQLIESKLDKKS